MGLYLTPVRVCVHFRYGLQPCKVLYDDDDDAYPIHKSLMTYFRDEASDTKLKPQSLSLSMLQA